MTKLFAFIVTAVVCFYAGIIASHYLTGDIDRVVMAALLILGSLFLGYIIAIDSNNRRRTWSE